MRREDELMKMESHRFTDHMTSCYYNYNIISTKRKSEAGVSHSSRFCLFPVRGIG